MQHIDNQHVVNVIHLQGRPSWPSGRSTDLISEISFIRTVIYLPNIRDGPYPIKILCKPLILSHLQHSPVGLALSPPYQLRVSTVIIVRR